MAGNAPRLFLRAANAALRRGDWVEVLDMKVVGTSLPALLREEKEKAQSRIVLPAAAGDPAVQLCISDEAPPVIDNASSASAFAQCFMKESEGVKLCNLPAPTMSAPPVPIKLAVSSEKGKYVLDTGAYCVDSQTGRERQDDSSVKSRLESDFTVLSLLGKGAFGAVFAARSSIDGQVYAVKVIPIEDGQVNNEAKAMSMLSMSPHPAVVRYFGAWTDVISSSLAGLLSSGEEDEEEEEFATTTPSPFGGSDSDFSSILSSSSSTSSSEAGSCFDDGPSLKAGTKVVCIQQQLCDEPLREYASSAICGNTAADLARSVRILLQVAEGLEHMHELGITHCDLSPANIFIKAGKPYIGDFGCCHFEGDDNERRCCASGEDDFLYSQYQAPETHRKSTSKITQAADVYSFVKIAVEMLSIAETAMERSLILCKTEAFLSEGRALSRVPEGGAKEELRRLLIAGLSANPVDRPSLSQLRSVIDALPL